MTWRDPADDSERTMVNVNIEIPDELHRRLKLAAVSERTTLKDLVADLLAQQEQHGQHQRPSP